MLLQPNDNKARQYICKALGIESDIDKIQITLKRPIFANAKLEIDNFDESSHFWGGTAGVMRTFLERMLKCIRESYNHGGDIYNKARDKYLINIDRELFFNEFQDMTIAEQFRLFDNLETLEMIDSIHYAGETIIGFLDQFSDGQFQSVYIYSIIELFKDRNCITLLDEPDSFLHPEWQFEFLKQVFDITDDDSAKKPCIIE